MLQITIKKKSIRYILKTPSRRRAIDTFSNNLKEEEQ
jgi:hypothetical protein